VRAALRPHGGSIVILTTGDLLKAHIHTDAPDAVFKLASTWGTLESTIVDDRAYRDRLELTPREFFRRLRTGHDASTSQPAPQAFADAYKDAARAADQVIAVVVSSALSGTHGNAESAARHFDSSRVTVLDSRSASLGEGLLVVRGVELAAAGWEADAIVKELQRVRAQSGGVSGDAHHTGNRRARRDWCMGRFLSE